MKTELHVHRSHIAADAGDVYDWHIRDGAFERLAPPWQRVEVVERSGGIEEGARVVMRVGPFRRRWVAVHGRHIPGREFRDVQVVGPFARWVHVHRFEPQELGGCVLEDRVEYALPLGALGRWAGGGLAQSEIKRLFRYRHAMTRGDLEIHARFKEVAPMHIAITGSRGLLGSSLVPFLTAGGHRVTRIVRRPRTGGHLPSASGLSWDTVHGISDPSLLEGIDAVVHLAGENIGAGRWSAARKTRIRQSRVDGTRRLAETIAGLEQPPRVLVCASAIGYYGNRGEELLDENSLGGRGFLADLCREWEAAAEPAVRAGVRTVHLRFGVILSPAGGALARMLPLFRLGAGGVLGSGRQFMSWVGIDDAVGAVLHALASASVSGPVNVVSPEPVTNAEFTRILARVLGRPALMSVPAFALRLAFGELADETLLSSQRAAPARLLATGFRFREAGLEGALRGLLGREHEETAGKGAQGAT